MASGLRLHLTLCVARVLQQCVLFQAFFHNNFLDCPFELVRVKSALNLASDRYTVSPFQKYPVPQQHVGVDTLVDRHLEPAEHDRYEAVTVS